MNLSPIDYLLVRIAQSAPGLLRRLGNAESRRLADQLQAIPIERPVFLTGLARSGTTILLEELTKLGIFATHQYRDFPFLMTPCYWNRFLDRFAATQPSVERPHRDRIQITAASPEAFEEPLWQAFFPHVHDAQTCHLLTDETVSPEFDLFFSDHLRKIMLLRDRRRYLSKGNYNLTRIPYLARLFSDARFVVPIRHPGAHVRSLVCQHELFTSYAEQDSRVPTYLRAAGHYEFGPQRAPIRLDSDEANRTLECWKRGDEAAGYAIQWAQVYRHVATLRDDPRFSEQILVVRYEDFCDDPRGTLSAILDHVDAPGYAELREADFSHIAPPASEQASTPGDVWDLTAEVAGQFGYERDGLEAGSPSEPALASAHSR